MVTPLDPDVMKVLVSFGARIDALTWLAGALLQSHPNPGAVLAAWRARQADAADSGFEIDSPEYREKFLAELQLWTRTLEAEAARRR